jgi:hypothetical protein
MDWSRVADHLESEAERLVRDASGGFPNDHVTQREMLTRASIFHTFAKAIQTGNVQLPWPRRGEQ